VNISENVISEVQNGFGKGWSCIECICTAVQLIEEWKEHNLPTYVGFTDYKFLTK